MTSRPLRASGTKASWMGVGSKYRARWRAASTVGESDRAWKPLGLSTSIAVDKQTSKESHTYYQTSTFSSWLTVNLSGASVQCPSVKIVYAHGRSVRDSSGAGTGRASPAVLAPISGSVHLAWLAPTY